MIELNTKQQARLLTFVNKAYTKVAELGEEARLEDNARKRDIIVQKGLFLADFLWALDGRYNEWGWKYIREETDRFINEYDLFEVTYNPTQGAFEDVMIRPIQGFNGESGDYALQTSLNSESLARQAQDQLLRDSLDNVNKRIDDLDFSGLIPNTVVFSEETVGYPDFGILIESAFVNKDVLDSISEQDLLKIDEHELHVENQDIHVSLSDKNNWDSKVSQGELVNALFGKSDLVHNHEIGNINGLQTALDDLTQSILDNAAEDGFTPSISIGTISTGTTPTVTLDPLSTVENPILNFVLPEGIKGDTGDSFSFGAIDFLVNRPNYIDEDLGFSFIDIETGLLYYKQAESGLDEWSGGIKVVGNNGWTPLHVPEIIDNSGDPLIVHKLVDYIGGEGVKPTDNIDLYLSSNGYVSNPLLAVNYKGNKGDKPVEGVDYVIEGFSIDETISYDDYLLVQDDYSSSKSLQYTLYFEGSQSPYETKDGRIAILSVDASSLERVWKEYAFKGDKGDPGSGEGGSGGVSLSSIINNFTNDPDDVSKVAGANSVYNIFQDLENVKTILSSDDPLFDTVQERVDVIKSNLSFIENIDTSGEFIAFVDSQLGTDEWRGSTYKAIKDSGSISFDRNKIYGESSPLTGDISISNIDYSLGVTSIVLHNDSEIPEIVTDLNKLEHGQYVPNTLNQIFILSSGNSTISISYTQPVFTAGTVDNTAPTITSATVENGNESTLVLVFSESVNILDLTDLSIQGDFNGGFLSVLSGNNTNSVSLEIDGAISSGQNISFFVGENNTITDLSNNSNGIEQTSFAITNNIGGAVQLDAPTNFQTTSVSSNSVSLSWDVVSNADNYVIQRGLQANYSDAVDIVTTNLLQYTDSTVSASTIYYYRIKAIDDVDQINLDSNYTTLTVTTPVPVSQIISSKGVAVYNVNSIDVNSANVRNDAGTNYLINWIDQSTNSNNASQVTDANQFRIEETTNSLLPDGVNDFMTSGVINFDSISGFSAYFCLQRTDSESLQVLLGRGTQSSYNSFFIKSGSDYQFRMLDAASNNLIFNIGSSSSEVLGAIIMEIHHDGSGNAELLINGQIKSSLTNQTSVIKSYDRIGSRSSGNYFTGKINAIEVYDLLTSSERENVRSSLAAQFNIALS